MNIEIKENVIPDLNDLLHIYRDACWSNYTSSPDMLMNAYKNSLMVLTAWSCNQLVGVIRIVGDGCSIIYVQDIIVLKEYQRKGVGKQLFQCAMKKFENAYQKVLLTDKQEKTEGFYRKMGFVPSEEYDCVSFVQFRH